MNSIPQQGIKQKQIPKIPYKILDAPCLQDDFYLNLLEWSCQDYLAVSLGPCVYLWSGQTGRVNKLCETTNQEAITSLTWSPTGQQLCLGTNQGDLQVWDVHKNKKIREMLQQHQARIGSLACSQNILCSGSKDKTIMVSDIRQQNQQPIKRYLEHKQEVCGLKWSFDHQQLASGGNDNKLFIWNLHSNQPIRRFCEHKAAVKAIAWSPHQHGLIASGGGTADRTIRFWNTLYNTQIGCINSDSQVCNLTFSKNSNELISTHGYSMNQIMIWKYPSLENVAYLTGHTSRVLYLAMSPDGESIVTGAGDETLRFWNIFPKDSNKNLQKSNLLVGNAKELR